MKGRVTKRAFTPSLSATPPLTCSALQCGPAQAHTFVAPRALVLTSQACPCLSAPRQSFPAPSSLSQSLSQRWAQWLREKTHYDAVALALGRPLAMLSSSASATSVSVAVAPIRALSLCFVCARATRTGALTPYRLFAATGLPASGRRHPTRHRGASVRASCCVSPPRRGY